MLDIRNTKYITTAQSRLNFLLNEETDIEGRIIECLKKIDYIDDENFFDDDFFDIFLGANIDENSLYKPYTKKSKVETEPLIDEYNDNPEEIEKRNELKNKGQSNSGNRNSYNLDNLIYDMENYIKNKLKIPKLKLIADIK